MTGTHVKPWRAPYAGLVGTVLLAAQTCTVLAQPADAGLAQELTNPLADLVTVPIQMNFDRRIGPADEGTRFATNVQPVIPFEGAGDWNVISRTIVPIVYQDDVVPGAGSRFGLGDVSLTAFLSPKRPAADGLIWGAGPVLLVPSATDARLGGKKWGAGPSAVALTMRGPWTAGILANHVWSFAGDGARQDISNTFLQPFLAYTWPSAWTASVQAEANYDWTSATWSLPINVGLAKLVKLGALPVSLQAGVGYWAESPDAGPKGPRFRLQANVVLPR